MLLIQESGNIFKSFVRKTTWCHAEEHYSVACNSQFVQCWIISETPKA